MGAREILLHWKGPVNFERFAEKKSPPDLIEVDRTGIYLHCLRMAEAFAVIYVGKADPTSVWSRNKQHYRNIKKFSWAFFDWKGFENRDDLDVTFIPNYDDKSESETKRDPAQLIERLSLFYAPYSGDENISGIEGAIQIHLWRNMATRKYLITPISNYSLRDKIIENDFDCKDTILGFNGGNRVIRTPSPQ